MTNSFWWITAMSCKTYKTVTRLFEFESGIPVRGDMEKVHNYFGQDHEIIEMQRWL
jgi:hypothetical protein